MISIAVGAVVTESGEKVRQTASRLVITRSSLSVRGLSSGIIGGRGYKGKADERAGRIEQPSWCHLWD